MGGILLAGHGTGRKTVLLTVELGGILVGLLGLLKVRDWGMGSLTGVHTATGGSLAIVGFSCGAPVAGSLRRCFGRYRSR